MVFPIKSRHVEDIYAFFAIVLFRYICLQQPPFFRRSSSHVVSRLKVPRASDLVYPNPTSLHQ